MVELMSGVLGQSLDAVSVIMAGGSGTRFWPWSRTAFPKQFLPLASSEGHSLIQQTASRMRMLSGANSIVVVTAAHQAQLVKEQVEDAFICAEPSARNTAACVGFAALAVLEHCGDVPMVCVPADHVVEPIEEIVAVYRDAVSLAREEDVLVTIGVTPTAPETGYGYIHSGEPHSWVGKKIEKSYTVRQFVEKPDSKTAQEYLDSGEFFWNSGMFVWRPSVILAQMEKFIPETYKGLQQIQALFAAGPDKHEQLTQLYNQLPSVSIDVGVMEKADNVVMLPGDDFRWSDIGSWSSWADFEACKETDTSANVLRGNVVLHNTKNTAILGGKKLIAGIGLEDIVIVDTEDALMVCHRDSVQNVKAIVEELKASNRLDLV